MRKLTVEALRKLGITTRTSSVLLSGHDGDMWSPRGVATCYEHLKTCEKCHRPNNVDRAFVAGVVLSVSETFDNIFRNGLCVSEDEDAEEESSDSTATVDPTKGDEAYDLKSKQQNLREAHERESRADKPPATADAKRESRAPKTLVEAGKARCGNINIDELKEKLEIDKAYRIMHRLTDCFTSDTSYLEASHVRYTSPWHAISGNVDEFK